MRLKSRFGKKKFRLPLNKLIWLSDLNVTLQLIITWSLKIVVSERLVTKVSLEILIDSVLVILDVRLNVKGENCKEVIHLK